MEPKKIGAILGGIVGAIVVLFLVRKRKNNRA